MSVTINEMAFNLLFSEEGPVGREVQQRAEQVVSAARQNIAFIMARSPVDASGAVDYVIDADGSARIGIRDEGRISQYLDAKAAREPGTPGDWMRNALRAVFPG